MRALSGFARSRLMILLLPLMMKHFRNVVVDGDETGHCLIFSNRRCLAANFPSRS